MLLVQATSLLPLSSLQRLGKWALIYWPHAADDAAGAAAVQGNGMAGAVSAQSSGKQQQQPGSDAERGAGRCEEEERSPEGVVLDLPW